MKIQDAIPLLVLVLNNAARFSAAIGAAAAEGREELSDEEVRRFRSGDDLARVGLQAEIDDQSRP